ncbi:MAG TPA: hypothetical protein VHL11_08050 [Phototrophicaceae bacterium]|nr:hypothetical protein [Phototrophicaceae bacterium]
MAISVEMIPNESVINIKVDSRLNYQMVCNARQVIAQIIARNASPMHCITELSLSNVSLTETMETIKLLTRNLSGNGGFPNLNHYFVGHDQLASFASNLICRLTASECQVYDSVDEVMSEIHAQGVPARV